jgi:hypothetical protein
MFWWKYLTVLPSLRTKNTCFQSLCFASSVLCMLSYNVFKSSLVTRNICLLSRDDPWHNRWYLIFFISDTIQSSLKSSKNSAIRIYYNDTYIMGFNLFVIKVKNWYVWVNILSLLNLFEIEFDDLVYKYF